MANNFINKTISADPEYWEDFKVATKENDSDASKEIRKFVKKYMQDHKAKKAKLGLKN